MTQQSLTTLANATVPARAMTTALMLACRLGEGTSLMPLLMIARSHGGDELMAQAIQLRLNLLAMLLEIDPTVELVTAKLQPHQIGAVLAEFPVGVRDGSLDFDGDALASALQLATEPDGAA